MTITASGYGAGTRELSSRPNVLQLVLGDAVDAGAAGTGDGQPLVELSANVDDATGEQLAHDVAELLEAGAADAWITPVVMKKGRPGHVVSVLADPALAAPLAAVLTTETGSLGVRARPVDAFLGAARLREAVVVGAAELEASGLLTCAVSRQGS